MSKVLNFFGWMLVKESQSSDIVDSISFVQAGRLLKPGRSGEAVKQIQKWLGVPQTGEYDGITINAVRKFQEENPPLNPDGIVGKLTISQMVSKFSDVKNAPATEEVEKEVKKIESDPAFKPDPVADSDKIEFPIMISGSYTVDNSVPARGDALHAFDRRKSDKFGGRMLRGWEDNTMRSKWGRLVKLDQDLGINQVLKKLIDLGIKPDVEDIKITTSGNRVSWQAKIVKSRDGKTWAGVDTRGSAGGGKQNALNQVATMKKASPQKKNWTVVHEIDRPGLNQFFLKYTL